MKEDSSSSLLNHCGSTAPPCSTFHFFTLQTRPSGRQTSRINSHKKKKRRRIMPSCTLCILGTETWVSKQQRRSGIMYLNVNHISGPSQQAKHQRPRKLPIGGLVVLFDEPKSHTHLQAFPHPFSPPVGASPCGVFTVDIVWTDKTCDKCVEGDPLCGMCVCSVTPPRWSLMLRVGFRDTEQVCVYTSVLSAVTLLVWLSLSPTDPHLSCFAFL